ncbi:hypothetical protein CBL_12207 [Carabus blaptoides fortunei]
MNLTLNTGHESNSNLHGSPHDLHFSATIGKTRERETEPRTTGSGYKGPGVVAGVQVSNETTRDERVCNRDTVIGAEREIRSGSRMGSIDGIQHTTGWMSNVDQQDTQSNSSGIVAQRVNKAASPGSSLAACCGQ